MKIFAGPLAPSATLSPGAEEGKSQVLRLKELGYGNRKCLVNEEGKGGAIRYVSRCCWLYATAKSLKTALYKVWLVISGVELQY